MERETNSDAMPLLHDTSYIQVGCWTLQSPVEELCCESVVHDCSGPECCNTRHQHGTQTTKHQGAESEHWLLSGWPGKAQNWGDETELQKNRAQRLETGRPAALALLRRGSIHGRRWRAMNHGCKLCSHSRICCWLSGVTFRSLCSCQIWQGRGRHWGL